MPSPEWLRKIGDLFKKKETPAARAATTKVEAPKSGADAGSTQPETSGHVTIQAPEAVAPTKFSRIERNVTDTIAQRIKDAGVQNIPNRRLEIVVEEAAKHGEVNAQVRTEVTRISRLLTEEPSRDQWTEIQTSLNTLSSYSSADVIEVTKYVRKEVSTYAFSQVVRNAERYGLTAGDAAEVAKTFRHASVADYRAEMRASGAAAGTDIQQSLEQTFVEAEVAREWDTVSQIAKDAQARKDTEDLGNEADELRKWEDISIDEAKSRIRDLIKDYPADEKAWMESLINGVNENREAAGFLLTVAEAGADALRSPAYLFAKGTQWRVETFDKLAKMQNSDPPALEALALQRAFVSRILEQQAKIPSATDMHNINFSKVDESIIQANVHFEGTFGGVGYKAPSVEWWMKKENGHNGVLYGADDKDKLFGVVTNPEIRAILEEAQARFDADPKGAQGDYLVQVESRLKQTIKDITDKKGTLDSNVYEYYSAVTDQIMALRDMKRDHVNLGASYELKEHIWEAGPVTVLNEYMAMVEKYSKSYEGDTFPAQNAMKHLEQAAAYVTDTDLFASEYRRYQLMKGRNIADVNLELTDMINNVLPDLSNVIDLRRNLSKNYNAFFAVGVQAEKLSQLLSPLGSEGALKMLGYSDGRVAAVMDYFDAQIMTAHRALHTDDKIWLSQDQIKDIFSNAIEGLKAGELADLEGMSVAQIEELALLAQQESFILGRPILAMARGIGPIEQGFNTPGTRLENVHPFSGGGGSNLERAVKAKQHRRFGDERWLIDNDATISMLDDADQLAAMTNKASEVVDELIARAKERGRLEDLVRQTCEISTADLADWESASIISGKIAKTYLKFDRDGNARTAPKTLAEAAKDIPLLRERMMSKLGKLIVERSPMSYTFMDSGPVTYQTQTKLAEMFTYSDQLAISMQLRDAYAGLISAKDHHAKDHAIEHLETVLEKAAEYNPVDLLNGHVDTHNMLTDDWFAGLNNADLQKFLSAKDIANGGIKSTGDLISVLTKQTSSLESLIKRKVREGVHLKRVNWHHVTDPQMEEIRKMLRAYTGKKSGTDAEIGLNEFVNTMKAVSKHVGSPEMIKDATKIDFSVRYGYQTNNSADCWLDIAEEGKFGDRMANVKPLSQKLGRRGSGDMLIRTYGDLETALKGVDIIFMAYRTHDWKTFVKAIGELQATLRNVYGDPWDGRAVMYLTGGLLRGMSQDALTEWTFGMTSMFRAKDSKLKRVLNSEHGPAVEIEQRYEYIGEIENLINTSLHSVDHELAEVFMEYVGLNFGANFHLVENDILWAKRIYRVAAFAAVLMAVAAVKEASEGYNEASGGGGGGGGGAPAHH